MNDVFIVSAARTPIGRFGGSLKGWGPAELAEPVLAATLSQARVTGSALDLVILGNVLRAGRGQLVARQAAIKAGIPPSVDALSVDMVCSSGMMSVMTATAHIRAGDAHLILAGGTESMSSTGFYLSGKARWGYKYLPGDKEPLTDVLYGDGLSDPLSGEAMGDQAERLVAEVGADRLELDEIACRSHQRAEAAARRGDFAKEIVPLSVRSRKGIQELREDEGVRADTTTERLGRLKPVFHAQGALTAGNSSQISDGAAAVLLASGEAVKAHRLTVHAKIVSSAWAAGTSWRFLEVPSTASRRALRRAQVEVADVSLFENNEAFSLSSYLFHRQLGVPYDRLNVHGGAIALGHPIGCSGTRILVTLLHALHTHGQTLGLAAICHGMGGGTALVLEAV